MATSAINIQAKDDVQLTVSGLRVSEGARHVRRANVKLMTMPSMHLSQEIGCPTAKHAQRVTHAYLIRSTIIMITRDRNITAALRTARPAHLSVAARAVTRIGLGRRVQLVQQATTYQEASVLVARIPVVQDHTARVVIALAAMRTTHVPHARLGLIKM